MEGKKKSRKWETKMSMNKRRYLSVYVSTIFQSISRSNFFFFLMYTFIILSMSKNKKNRIFETLNIKRRENSFSLDLSFFFPLFVKGKRKEKSRNECERKRVIDQKQYGRYSRIRNVQERQKLQIFSYVFSQNKN